MFPLVATLLGLALFGLAEALFAALDWGRPSRFDDPFVGFSAIHPLFVLDDSGTRYEVARSRLKWFRPESFAAVKPSNEFRIFCLGGSTVQGNPWGIETSFTTWLEISLQAADPSRRWEVVNCGGISYASYRLVPILEELLAHQPDLFIVCTGHNEFLEDRTYGHIKRAPAMLWRTQEVAASLRTYTLLRAGLLGVIGRRDDRPSQDRSVLGPEVDAWLDYRGGLDAYHRDDEWRQAVIEHYGHNLRRMVAIARAAGVPLLLVNPVCNLRDSPPFKAQHRDGLGRDELERWEQLWTAAREQYSSNLLEAVSLLKRAMAIDDQHAGMHYDLAKCYDSLGNVNDAHRSYIRAKELDICPLRILEPMNQAVLEVARQSQTPAVDVRQLFERLSPGGIPGNNLLVDHVHPSIRGHQLIADALADELVLQGFLQPSATWQDDRDRKYREQFASLDGFYFIRGQQHLESLRQWTRGRLNRVRADQKSSRDHAAVSGSGLGD
ncbi:MAG: SGNH/GDSL hydrolase family protein [Planctomycetes bacterium]|nr:SGNH/GDSL hydrolase family protein [Planctomycetota bacterium]